MKDEIEVYQQRNKTWRFRVHKAGEPAPLYLSEGRFSTRDEAVRVAKVCNELLWAGAYRLKVRRPVVA